LQRWKMQEWKMGELDSKGGKCGSKPYETPNSILYVLYYPHHVLHQLLPPVKDTIYNLPQRSHSLTLSSEDSNLIRKNFLYRMLYKDIY